MPRNVRKRRVLPHILQLRCAQKGGHQPPLRTANAFAAVKNIIVLFKRRQKGCFEFFHGCNWNLRDGKVNIERVFQPFANSPRNREFASFKTVFFSHKYHQEKVYHEKAPNSTDFL